MAEEKPPEKYKELVSKMRSDPKLIRSRSYNFKKYPKTLQGDETAKWLVENGEAKDADEAVAIGQKLVEIGLLHHVHDDHNFKNDKLFYRFRVDEDKLGATQSKLAALTLASDCDLKGTLMKKGKVKWNNRFFVLRSKEKKLYYYETETDPSPKQVIDLNEGSIDVSECGECKKGTYCFNIVTPKRVHVCCCEKSKDQEAWITALIQSGASFVEDKTLAMVTAKSLFEFTALDINKQEVNLNKFQGKVCLVVNVACE